MEPYVQHDGLEKDPLKNIVDAAGVMFARYGTRSVSVDDITRQIGISKKTFYKYFEDKERLVQFICERKLQELKMNILATQRTGNTLEEASAIFDVVNGFSCKFSRLFFRDIEIRHPQIHALFLKARKYIVERVMTVNIKQGISSGVYRREIDPKVVARLWFDVCVLAYTEGYAVEQVKAQFIHGMERE